MKIHSAGPKMLSADNKLARKETTMQIGDFLKQFLPLFFSFPDALERTAQEMKRVSW